MKEGFALLDENVDAAFTVVHYSYPVQRRLKKNPAGFVELNFPEYADARTQHLEPIYHDAVHYYLVKTKTFRDEFALWYKRTAPLILSELEVQDLDTPTDWQLAEMKFKLTR